MTQHKQLRESTISRDTAETSINIQLRLDGSSQVTVTTGYGMGDHMLSLLAFWAGMDLTLQCRGDLHIDAHHTMEDIGIVLGQALHAALGDRKGIARTGFAKVPMDEALAEACVDFSGRGYHVMQGEELLPAIIAHEEKDIWREFFTAFARAAGANIHIIFHYGKNGHHLLESACKSLGLAIRAAIAQERSTMLSTKGSLDL